jgi:drug/metabolite transporter (DMT)-like permease
MPALSQRVRLLTAFFLVYFIWGSTYLAIRYAVATLPPFLMAGSRFLLAGLLMLLVLRWRGVPLPSWSQWWRLGLVGLFLFLGGNGIVAWAEQDIDSGLAALLVSLLPLWLIVLDWLWAGGPRPSLRGLSGVALGVLGTAVLLAPPTLFGTAAPAGEVASTPAADRFTLLASLLLVLASLLWAIGSIYLKTFARPASVFMSAACQMLGGGLGLLLFSALLGEWRDFELAQVSLLSLGGFAYLMVFGSMVAISSYVWLLQNASASSVSTYAFVNPVVALLLGWLLADEPLTLPILLGAAIILLGVVLVVLTPAGVRRGSA